MTIFRPVLVLSGAISFVVYVLFYDKEWSYIFILCTLIFWLLSMILGLCWCPSSYVSNNNSRCNTNTNDTSDLPNPSISQEMNFLPPYVAPPTVSSISITEPPAIAESSSTSHHDHTVSVYRLLSAHSEPPPYVK